MHGVEENSLESQTAEGESPVSEDAGIRAVLLSSAGHVVPCVNPAGPSAKAKHSPDTDSEPVP